VKLEIDLSTSVKASWDSENGLMKISHVPTDTNLVLTPAEQVRLITLVETIVEKDLPIGKRT